MNDYPPVIATIFTYRRLNLALETIRSIKEKLIYPNIGFHIADDGSGIDYIARLIEEIGPEYSLTVSDAQRGGVGKSMNLGVTAALERADLWAHTEDDWTLPEPLDLTPCVRLLMEDESIGMVRLGRLSAGPRAQVIGGADKVWWKFEKNSDTYVFSGNASLRHRRFHDAYGQYTEGLTPGKTELNYCHKFNTTEGPSIVWAAWLTPAQTFQHAGDHQSFKWQQETGGLTAEQAADIFEEMDSAPVEG